MENQPKQDDLNFVEKLINDPEISDLVYYGTIILSGFLFITFLVNSGLPFTRSIFFMSCWWLIISFLLEPPEGALLESDPFDIDD